jgi:signal transduction histidine kinase
VRLWRNTRQWLRAHPFITDGGVALVATMLNLLDATATELRGYPMRGPDGWSFLLAVLGAAPIAVRRRYPFTAGLVVSAAYFTQTVFDINNSTVGGFVVLFVTYTVGAYARLWLGVGLVIAQIAAAVAVVFTKSDMLAALGVTVTPLFVVLTAAQFPGVWIVGRAIRARRLYLAELEDRTDRLERTATAEIRAALAEERARVARELHDVVAHHVSVMTVQAAAARRTLHRDPDRSAEAMRAVEDTGRSALDEMRRIVGALRTADPDPTDTTDLAPQAGVNELDPLLDRAREAGLDVELSVLGTVRTLPAGIDLAIYRVVQEALTNTLKHAGPTRARVMLRYEPDAVAVAVTDDGSIRTPKGEARLGHGLIGMRERISLNGGTLRTGPRVAGGFQVSARIPIESVAKDH